MAKHMILRFLMVCGYLFIIGITHTVSPIDGMNADTNSENNGGETKKPFSLELLQEINSYDMPQFNGTWISDNNIIFTNDVHDIFNYSVETGESRLIFNASKLNSMLKSFSPNCTLNSEVSFSANEEYVLFDCTIKQVVENPTLRYYIVYDMKNGKFEKIADGANISLAMWSPIDSGLAYVLDNDIYYMTFDQHPIDNVTRLTTRRLTTTGKPGVIYNGIPDWIYGGNVFSTALWYSSDGRYLAFATFNDEAVKDMVYVSYGNPGTFEDQYPTLLKIKYPKPGTPHPTVTLKVIDLNNSSLEAIVLKSPIDIVGSDHILWRVSWWNQTYVMATWSNRVQNKSQLMMYDMQGNGSPIFYLEETEGWLQQGFQKFWKVNDYILHLQPKESGTCAGRFRHIVRYEYRNDQFASPMDLTPGSSEVLAIIAVDSSKGIVYYLATAPGKPSQNNLYSVRLDGAQESTCTSCEFLTPEGNQCTYAIASFSKKKSYYAFTCEGPDPNIVTINNNKHELVRIWNNNSTLKKSLSQRYMPLFRNFNITVNGYDARVRLMLPHDFSENKSYPLLVKVYGGPTHVIITDHVGYSYEYHLTTNRSIICALIDVRGSTYKGSKMLFQNYRNLGIVEVEDAIAVTVALQRQYGWIDANKTGVWGWSYGGYTTGMILAKDKESIFKCGISIAPVTSWLYYESMYTERYMGMPTASDNLAGYNRSDLTRHVEGIRGKKYMLIHGSKDHNVHYQHAMMLAKSLEQKNILFEQVTYTDQGHHLSGVPLHLFYTMDKFWGDCFNLKHTN